jgi:hypothetical protein
MEEADDRAGTRPRRPEAEAVMALKIRVYSDYV